MQLSAVSWMGNIRILALGKYVDIGLKPEYDLWERVARSGSGAGFLIQQMAFDMIFEVVWV
jgi:hypothetical protein